MSMQRIKGIWGPGQGHFTVLWTCPCSLDSIWNLSPETNQAEVGFEPTSPGGDCDLNTGPWNTWPARHMLTRFLFGPLHSAVPQPLSIL